MISDFLRHSLPFSGHIMQMSPTSHGARERYNFPGCFRNMQDTHNGQKSHLSIHPSSYARIQPTVNTHPCVPSFPRGRGHTKKKTSANLCCKCWPESKEQRFGNQPSLCKLKPINVCLGFASEEHFNKACNPMRSWETSQRRWLPSFVRWAPGMLTCFYFFS